MVPPGKTTRCIPVIKYSSESDASANLASNEETKVCIDAFKGTSSYESLESYRVFATLYCTLG